MIPPSHLLYFMYPTRPARTPVPAGPACREVRRLRGGAF